MERTTPAQNEQIHSVAMEAPIAVADEHDSQHVTGRGWHGDPAGHAAAGRKGGSKVSQNRGHMAEIGRRGGTKVAQDRGHMAEIGRRGGAKVAQDRDHMAEIGKRGGENK